MLDGIFKIPFDISNEDRKKCIFDIEKLFEDDNWCKDVPYYQTWPLLFEREEEHWRRLKYRISLVMTLLNPKIKRIICWSYASFVGKKGSVGNGWHNHVLGKENDSVLSCIFYLQTETYYSGTMFDVGDTIVIPKVCTKTLYIYNPTIMHTPTYWDYENETKNRITLAMDGHCQ